MPRINLSIYFINLILNLFLAGCSLTLFQRPTTRGIVSSSLPIEVIWQSELDEVVVQQPIVASDAVVISTNQAIYGLDIVTGDQRWKHSIIYQPTPIIVAIAEDKVIFGDKQGQITVLNMATGETIWQRKIGERKDNYFSSTSIIVDSGVVYVATQPTSIEAIDLNRGELVWSIPRGSQYGIPGRGARLFLHEDNLYLFTTEVHIFNPTTGEVKQAIQTNIRPSQLINGKFYDRNMVWDATNLNVIGKLESLHADKFGENCNDFTSPYTFSKTQLYAAGQCGGIYALEINNNQIQWQYRPDILGESPMAIYNETLYILFDNGEIHAIDPKTGEVLGILKSSLELPGSVKNASFLSRGIVADDSSVLIVTFNDRNVWAFCKKPCSSTYTEEG